MRLISLIAFILLAVTPNAFAHFSVEHISPSLDEQQQSVFVPAHLHLLAIAALGLRLGQNSRDKVIYTIVIFGLSLIVGHLASLSGFASFYLMIGLLGVTILIGTLTLIGIEIKPLETTVAPIIVALMIGIDSGVAAESLALKLSALMNSAMIGFFFYVFWVVLIWLLSQLKRDWIKIGFRVLASWITAVAAMIISLFLAA